MPSNANINVRVGFLFDTKSLTALERQLQRTGQRLARVGTDISLFISAPLALLGGNAIKAAGEFESLSLAMQATFKNAGRTIEQANAEVEELRKAALAPGLDFPQAVAASIRLQSVGLSAEKARDVIKELANAVASTGGTALQLESVTVQMSQMISKGKVLSQDLRIIQENLPIISDLMLKAFGTSNAEAIQELGLSGRDFVEGITTEMTKLTRVQGGIANALVNAGSAIKQALAAIGTEIAKTFNITDLSDRFAASLAGLVEWFQSLSDGAKKAVVYIGAFLVALGPLAAIIGAVNSVSAILVGALGSLAGAFNAVKVAMFGADAALGRLKLAFGIISLVVGLGAAIYALSDNFDAAEFAAQKFSDAQKEVVDSTAAEIGAINKAFVVIKDVTKSYFERGQALDSLKKQYPEYLKGIEIETVSVARLTEIHNDLNQSILRGVAERQKASAVNAIYEQQAKILLRIQQLRDGQKATSSEAALIDTGDMLRAGSISAAVIKKMEAQAAELGAQVGIVSGQFDRAFGTMKAAIDPALQAEYDMRDAAEAAKDALYDNATATKVNASSKKELAKATKDAAKEQDNALQKELDDRQALIDFQLQSRQIALDTIEAETKARQASIGAGDTSGGPGQELTLGLPLGEAVIGEQITMLAALEKQLEIASTKAIVFNDSQGLLAEKMKIVETAINSAVENGFSPTSTVVTELTEKYALLSAQAQQVALQMAQMEAIGDLISGLAGAISETLLSAEGSWKSFASAAIDSIGQVISSLVKLAVASAFTRTLGSSFAGGPIGLALAGAAAVLAGSLFKKLVGGARFAKGTKNAPGGISLVGEQGPELVNLPRHSQVYTANQTRNMLGGMGGGTHVTGEFRIRGTDLVVVLEQVQSKQRRTG